MDTAQILSTGARMASMLLWLSLSLSPSLAENAVEVRAFGRPAVAACAALCEPGPSRIITLFSLTCCLLGLGVSRSRLTCRAGRSTASVQRLVAPLREVSRLEVVEVVVLVAEGKASRSTVGQL